MIKSITSGRYMYVVNPATPHITAWSNQVGVGNMRFNTLNQTIEVFDGNTWVGLNGSGTYIDVSPEAGSILDWAKKKMIEEKELEELAKTNPTIADLYNQLNEKKSQIDVVRKLIQKETTVD